MSDTRSISVVVFAMTPVGHYHRLRPLIGGLVADGHAVTVATHQRFRASVEGLGADFHNLFAELHPDTLDPASEPPPLRCVTFAAAAADAVIPMVEELAPDVVISDTFAVIGRVVANALDVPHVNVCAGHDRIPPRVIEAYRVDTRVRVSPACADAVEQLRLSHGLEDASFLSWVTGVSPHLNVYCEPPSFLSDEGREAFEPIAFFGSVSDERGSVGEPVPWPREPAPGRRRVYACLGSVGWRLFHHDTRAAIETIVDTLAGRDDVDVLVSLGTADAAAADVAALQRENVRVLPWADQWSALGEADVFISHMGLNSAHEAIYHRVPTITYPLFADQPFLAAAAIERGIAVPLVDSLRAPVRPEDVDRALAEVHARSAELDRHLEAARALELEVIANRPRVIEQIAALGRAARVEITRTA